MKENYKTRKDSKGRTGFSSYGNGNFIGGFVFIGFGLSCIILGILDKIMLGGFNIPQDIFSFWTISGFLFLLMGIFWTIHNVKMTKSENIRKGGDWILKKVKITSIEDFYISRDKYSSIVGNKEDKSFIGHYIEAKDGDNIYCSDPFEGGILHGDSINELKEIYNHYGFKYDESLKNNVLNAMKKEKGEVDPEWIDMVKNGYKGQYLEINGHKISVGDYVYVYINPDDKDIYWMDIDFLSK